MSILIGDKKFLDEPTAIGFIRTVREKYGCNEDISLDSADGLFLHDLVRRSPSWPLKFTSCITGFKTGRFATRNQSGFSWMDRVGSSVHFSYRACIRNCPPSYADRLYYAAMQSVSSALIRHKGTGKCDNCDIELRRKLTSYLPPRTFLSLWKRFVSSHAPFALTRCDLLPPDIEREWAEYHRHNAVLRSLCVRCYYQDPENKS